MLFRDLDTENMMSRILLREKVEYKSLYKTA